MKLSELKPCACCNGPLCLPGIGTWYVLRVCQAMVNPQAANEVLGMTQMYGGFHALGIAEAMAPRPDEAVMILGDEEPKLLEEIHVCFNCWTGELMPVYQLFENARQAKKIEVEA